MQKWRMLEGRESLYSCRVSVRSTMKQLEVKEKKVNMTHVRVVFNVSVATLWQKVCTAGGRDKRRVQVGHDQKTGNYYIVLY